MRMMDTKSLNTGGVCVCVCVQALSVHFQPCLHWQHVYCINVFSHSPWTHHLRCSSKNNRIPVCVETHLYVCVCVCHTGRTSEQPTSLLQTRSPAWSSTESKKNFFLFFSCRSQTSVLVLFSDPVVKKLKRSCFENGNNIPKQTKYDLICKEATVVN